jgi:glycosyltransferase involved in cell wall biosynthesis
MTQFLVTIYIPTKNRIDMLRRAVNSCLSQSYQQIEIIVVDDASEAAIQAEVASLAMLDKRIRVFLQPESSGAPICRNIAISQARGEYITGLDDDDEFLDHRIADFVAAVKRYPTAGFYCSGYQYILPSGQRTEGLRQSRSISLDQLLNVNLVGNHVFCRLSDLRQAGGFDAEFVACQDYDLWIRLALTAGTGKRIKSISYVVHQEHDQIRISTQERRRKGHLQLLNKHQHLMSESQRRAHVFLPELYSGTPNLLTIFKKCPIRLMAVAFKIWFFRKLGYQL